MNKKQELAKQGSAQEEAGPGMARQGQSGQGWSRWEQGDPALLRVLSCTSEAQHQ